MTNVYVLARNYEDETDILGIYTTYDKALGQGNYYRNNIQVRNKFTEFKKSDIADKIWVSQCNSYEESNLVIYTSKLDKKLSES